MLRPVRYINVEILAFGLLGLGTIFILIGILSSRDKRSLPNNQLSSSSQTFSQTFTPIQHPASIPIETVNTETRVNYPESYQNSTKIMAPDRSPALSKAALLQPEKKSGIRRLDQNMEKSHEKVSPTSDKIINNIKITKSEQNPILYTSIATLYTDKSGMNLYDGNMPDSRLIDTTHIHRIGQGDIFFDGFTITFKYKGINEIYKLADIDKISFYPNCMALRKKQLPSIFLFFLDNTIHLKALLEERTMTHAAQ